MHLWHSKELVSENGNLHASSQACLTLPSFMQTKQIGALFGSGGQVIDNIQSSSHSLITVPPRAQRQYGQPVNISISAARDSNIQDAIAQIKETIARG